MNTASFRTSYLSANHPTNQPASLPAGQSDYLLVCFLSFYLSRFSFSILVFILLSSRCEWAFDIYSPFFFAAPTLKMVSRLLICRELKWSILSYREWQLLTAKRNHDKCLSVCVCVHWNIKLTVLIEPFQWLHLVAR